MKRYSYIKLQPGREYVFLPEIGCPNGSFKENVCKYANGLLNSNGGVVYFGCKTDGCIYGGKVSRKNEDDFRLAADHTIGSFHPFVSPSKYRLTFMFVENHSDLAIIELKVSIGDVGEIYENGFKNVYLVDNGALIGPLYPQELQELFFVKYKESIDGAEEARRFPTPNLEMLRRKSRLQPTYVAPRLSPIKEKVLPKIVKIRRY